MDLNGGPASTEAEQPVQHAQEQQHDRITDKSAETVTIKDSQPSWVPGITSKDEKDDKNTFSGNIVKTFTGYTLQFKTWNRKEDPNSAAELQTPQQNENQKDEPEK